MIFKNDLHTWFPWPIWPTSCSKGAVRAFMLSNTQRSESLCRFVAPWKLDHWPKTEIWQWVNMANMANGQIFVSIASYRDNQCQYTLQEPRESGLPHFQHKHVAGGIGKCCNMSQLLLWFQDLQRTKTLTTNSPLKDLGRLFWHIFTLYFWDFDRFPDGFRMFPGCPSGAVSPLSPLSQDLFRKAKNPDRVIAGVCFQVGIHWP